MDYTREIIKKIDSMSGSKSSFQVFSDWVKCTALSIAQSVYYSENREKQLLEIREEHRNREELLQRLNYSNGVHYSVQHSFL